MSNSNEGNKKALIPILVFVVLYLGIGILFEYILKIEMGFYSVPIVVVFMIALFVACLQNRELSLDKKIEGSLYMATFLYSYRLEQAFPPAF